MYFLTVLAVHSILCVTLIGLVLLQQGKGADAGATFGGGSSNSVFGAAGATDFITKLTTSLAIGFMVTSVLLIRAYSSGGAGVITSSPQDITEGSVMEQVVQPGQDVEQEMLLEPGTEEVVPEETATEGGLTVDIDRAEEPMVESEVTPTEESAEGSPKVKEDVSPKPE